MEISACRASYCPGNSSNIEKFTKNVDIIRSAEETNMQVLIDDYRAAIIFLSKITGVMARTDYSSTIGYRSKDDYLMDIKFWNNWLAKNKCKLTTTYIDSCMVKVQ